jgi:hypothetical protein
MKGTYSTGFGHGAFTAARNKIPSLITGTASVKNPGGDQRESLDARDVSVAPFGNQGLIVESKGVPQVGHVIGLKGCEAIPL